MTPAVRRRAILEAARRVRRVAGPRAALTVLLNR